MKRDYLVPLALLGLLLMLVASGWGFNVLLKQGAETLTQVAAHLESSIYQQDWDAAQLNYSQIKKTWLAMSKYWPMLIHHQEMDRIEESMSKLEIYLKYENAADAQAELSTLVKFIEHIPKKETFNLKNLL